MFNLLFYYAQRVMFNIIVVSSVVTTTTQYVKDPEISEFKIQHILHLVSVDLIGKYITQLIVSNRILANH